MEEETLEGFYTRGRGRGIHLRVDYNPRALGMMFREPLPHLHVIPHGEPRIVFPMSANGNVLADFFEFLSLNYFHPQWLAWAREMWSVTRHCYAISAESDPFEAIVAAFESNQLPYLRHQSTVLGNIKQALGEKKDKASPDLRLDIAVLELTSPHFRAG